MKRIVITVLSAALMVGAVIYAKTNGVALFEKAEGQQQKKEKVSSSVMAQPQIEALPISADSLEKVAVSQAPQPVISKDGAMTYSSIQKEAIVGLYEGRHSDNPADNIFEVVIDKNLKNTDIVMLSYKLTGLADFAGVSMSVNDQKSMGGYLVSNAKDTVAHNEQLNPAWLRKGMNRFLFSVPAPSYGYRISDLQVRIIPSDSEQPLVVTGSTVSYDNKAYVRGYVTDPSIKVVRVNGRSVDLSDGVFESVVALPSDRAVTVATLSNGKDVVKNVFVKSGVGADYVYEKSKDGFELVAHMETDSDGSIVAPTASLTVKSGDMKKSMDLSVSSLIDKDMPSLDYGMYNVTDSFSGYRFLPHGELFEGEGATVAMGYDRTKIPSGYTEDDIKTYYFDLNTKHWVALKRDSIDKEKRMILSKTNHFTDMINGIMKSPESPESKGFAPTTMSNLKPADPAQNVQLIQAPSANIHGTASVSYSIEMPPARNGMSPNLTVYYNSDGGSGWLGDGWNLATSVISVETRWGVPRYHPGIESETYLLDGQMLLEDGIGLSHRNVGQERKSGAVRFYPRVEGSFSKIERIGNDPSNYVWQVTDKKGVKYFYGKVNKKQEASKELDENGQPIMVDKTVVTGALMGGSRTYSAYQQSVNGKKDYEVNNVVSEWHITRMEDIHGDYVEFKYKDALEPILVVNGVPLQAGRAVYLDSVCVGNAGEMPHTVVTFQNRSKMKAKTLSRANYGYLCSNNALLEAVNVYFEGKFLRGYRFQYKDGVFYTDLLSKITQLDTDGKEFNSHELKYHELEGSTLYSRDPVNYTSKKSITSNLAEDLLEKVGAYDPKMSMISATSTDLSFSVGGGLYAGWGPASIGGSYNYIYNKVHGKETLIDIDGDGIPDKVTCDNDKVKFQKGMPKENTFGPELDVIGVRDFFENKSSGNQWGTQDGVGFGKLSVGVDYTSEVEKSNTRIYFQDFNADGLVDIGYRGRVYFNRIGADGLPHFLPYSEDTPNEMGESPSLPGGLEENPATFEQEQEEESPLMDVVRVWKPAFDGTVNINSVVKLAGVAAGDASTYDGVKCVIQNGDKVVKKADILPGASVDMSTTIKVKKDSYLYFRSSSIKQGIGDLVSWDPEIIYSQIDLNGITHTGTQIPALFVDQNGKSLYRYKASEDFVWPFNSVFPVQDPGGVTTVTGIPQKNIVTDSYVNFVIRYRKTSIKEDGDDSEVEEIIEDLLVMHYDKNELSSVTGDPEIAFQAENCQINQAGQYEFKFDNDGSSYVLEFLIESETPIPFETDKSEDIVWRPQITGMEGVNILPSRPLYNHINSFSAAAEFVVVDQLENVKAENPTASIEVDDHVKVVFDQDISKMNVYLYSNGGKSIKLDGDLLLSDLADYVGEKIRIVAYSSENLNEFPELKFHLERDYTCTDANGSKKVTKRVTGEYRVTILDVPYKDDVQLGLLYRGWGQFGYNGQDSDEDGANYLIDPTSWKLDENASAPEIQEPDPDSDEEPSFTMPTFTFESMSFSIEDGIGKYRATGLIDKSKGAIGSYIAQGTQSSSRKGNPIIESLELANSSSSGKKGAWPALFIKKRSRINNFSAGATLPDGLNWPTFSPQLIDDLKAYREYINAVKENGGVDDWSEGDSRKGKSWTRVYEHTITDVMDLNGDGYPDVIDGGDYDDNKISVYFTTPNGGIGQTATPVSKKFSNSYIKTKGKGTDESVRSEHVITLPVGKSSRNESNSSQSNGQNKDIAYTAYSAENESTSKSMAEHEWYDVNGDGLPDMLFRSEVALNLGYGFSERIPFQKTSVFAAYSYSKSNGKGLAVPIKGKACIGGGYNIGTSGTGVTSYLRDINGDGLPDLIYANNGKMYAKINIGNGFAGDWKIADLASLEESVATAVGGHVNFGMTIYLPFGFTTTPFVNGSTSWATSRSTSALLDFNGDGFPDQLTSEDEEHMSMTESVIGATNKLLSVTNPLGGGFTVDYAHSTPSYDHPCGKWVMSSLTVSDGVAENGPDQKFRFDYEGGKYDRREREFLGFGKVKSINLDEEGKDYREYIQLYNVANYYTAGNSEGVLICSKDEKVKYMEATTKYDLYEVTSGKELTLLGDDYNPKSINENSSYIYLTSKSSSAMYDESGQTPTPLSENSFVYDLKAYAHLLEHTFNNLTSNTGYTKKTTYEDNLKDGNYIIGLPLTETITGSDETEYKYTEIDYADRYTPYAATSIKQKMKADGDMAETKMKYDEVGNVIETILPANSNNQSMSFKFTYDRKYNMYVERVEDAFGYRYEYEDYDYKFGLPLTLRDRNGYTVKFELDNVGRVVKILAPKEQEAGSDYTLRYQYVLNTGKGYPYAMSDHFDIQHPGDPITVVTISDGMGRNLQVKGEAEITEMNGNTPSSPVVKMVASGLVKYDVFGRVVESYLPVVSDKGDVSFVNSAKTLVSSVEYDMWGRPIKKNLFDDNGTADVTKSEYAIEGGRLVTTITDPKKNEQKIYLDGEGRVVKTSRMYTASGNGSEESGWVDINYEYNPIGQLTSVVDAANNRTEYTYDMAGRRLSVSHPSNGTVSFEYDNAGNLLKRRTQKLTDEEGSIEYGYEYNRLKSISYVNHPENNVTLTYGGVNAHHNRVGRLALVEDGTGAQEFYYGRLGEVTKVRRTVIVPNNAVATYTTEWNYDSWNRLMSMTYPDGEYVKYSYDLGGNLVSVEGEKDKKYTYVQNIGYNEYGQRVYMKYGNGTETIYDYEKVRGRMNSLRASSPNTGDFFMNNQYKFDALNNITQIKNDVTPQDGVLGGKTVTDYTYDCWNRLISAHGEFTGGQGLNGPKAASYDLNMTYDKLYNVTGKTLDMHQSNMQFDGSLYAGHTLNYTYDDSNPFKLLSVASSEYRTEDLANKEDAMIETTVSYDYDANGNLVEMLSDKVKNESQDGVQSEVADEKSGDALKKTSYLWDDENLLLAVNENGYVSRYWYDVTGERVIKMSGGKDAVYLNGGKASESLSDIGNSFTAYVSPYLVVSEAGHYTKHVYVGRERILSKLGDWQSFGADPRRVAKAGDEVEELSKKIAYSEKYSNQTRQIGATYDEFEIPYNGKTNDDYVNGESFCCSEGDSDDNNSDYTDEGDRVNDESEVFFYHSDHLGSSSYITNIDGTVCQHIEYIPYGDIFIDERKGSWNTPYLFNAKELDEETGLYYYGARYLNPKDTRWISVDPLFEMYPGMSPYNYCLNNPVHYKDLWGQFATEEEAENYAAKTDVLCQILPYDDEHGGYFLSAIDDSGNELGLYAQDESGFCQGVDPNADGYGIVGEKIEPQPEAKQPAPAPKKKLGWFRRFDKWMKKHAENPWLPEGHADPANNGTMTKQDYVVGGAITSTILSFGVASYGYAAGTAGLAWYEWLGLGASTINNIDDMTTDNKGNTFLNDQLPNASNYIKTGMSAVSLGTGVASFKVNGVTDCIVPQVVDFGITGSGFVNGVNTIANPDGK